MVLPLLLLTLLFFCVCQLIPFYYCRFHAIGFSHISYNSKYVILNIILN
jgi:hypothetical protein